MLREFVTVDVFTDRRFGDTGREVGRQQDDGGAIGAADRIV